MTRDLLVLQLPLLEKVLRTIAVYLFLVLAQAPDTVGIVTADLDLGRLDTIREELPSLANRRL